MAVLIGSDGPYVYDDRGNKAFVDEDDAERLMNHYDLAEDARFFNSDWDIWVLVAILLIAVNGLIIFK
jgi:hypothetical protein